MNRLSIAQFVRRKCGISGSETTTVGATGEWSDVVSAVDEAYEDIQNERPDWLFLRTAFSFVTVAEQAEYAYASAPLSLADFGRWVDDCFRIYKTSISNEQWLTQWRNYDAFRDTFLLGSQRTQYGQPANITISPSKSLILALAPDDTSYTISGYYYKTPDVMDADADIPIIPARFHKLIAYNAIQLLAVNESAAELFEWGKIRSERMNAMLESDQLPPMIFL